MTARYEIKDNNTFEIFHNEATVPSLRQPQWPNGAAWADTAEATAWAELYVASINDEAAPFAPGARGEAGRAKPTAEERAARKAARKALDEAKTPEDRKAAREALRALFSK